MLEAISIYTGLSRHQYGNGDQVKYQQGEEATRDCTTVITAQLSIKESLPVHLVHYIPHTTRRSIMGCRIRTIKQARTPTEQHPPILSLCRLPHLSPVLSPLPLQSRPYWHISLHV